MDLNPIIRVYCEPYTYMERGIVINWHREESTDKLYYRKLGETTWIEVNSTTRSFPSSDVTVHRVVLDSLDSDTVYEFYFDDDGSTIYKFKTFSATPKAINIVNVSDHQDFAEINNTISTNINTQIMATNPDLIVFNGDHMNCEGVVNATNTARWEGFMDMICDVFVYDDNMMIPQIWTPGNHEVSPNYSGSDHTTPANYMIALFHRMVDQSTLRNSGSYGYFTAGSYLIIFCPDAGEMVDYEDQEQWWDDIYTLEGTKHKYALVYVHQNSHAFSVSYYADSLRRGLTETFRSSWCERMQKFNIKFVHQGHLHIWFQTHPLIVDEDNPAGVRDDDNPQAIVYTGAGGWSDRGRDQEIIPSNNPLYPLLQDSYAKDDGVEKVYHFFYTRLERGKIVVNSINDQGDLLSDDYVRLIDEQKDQPIMFTNV